MRRRRRSARHRARRRPRRRPQRRERRRNPVEAPVPADFLDEIRLARDVDAERRHVDVPAVRRRPSGVNPRRVEDPLDVARRAPRSPSSRRDARRAQRHAPRLGRPRVDVGDRRRPAWPAPICSSSASARRSARTGRRRGRRRARIGPTLRSSGRACGWSRAPTRAGTRRSRARSASWSADTSVGAPPMTPAMATARSRSAMTSIVSSSVRVWPSSVVSVSPARARRTRISGPAELRDVERVHRMAQLEHHVVGDVDDVVDGPDAGGGEPIGQPGRRRRRRCTSATASA